jgi:NAD(P)-dependent dehydrogenase (short-subunit alcohol dehydrogenase family)
MAETGRVVLVTGGTRGIGAAIAAAFAAEGDTVVVCARKAVDGCPHPFVSADLREAEACEGLIAHVATEYGQLDVLVNNAGGAPPSDTSTASPRFSEKIVRLNLLAPLWLSQYANAIMQEQENGGAIVQIASVAGLRPAPTVAAYGAAKAGLLNLCRTQALEWAPKVRVTAISPGFVSTERSLRRHRPGRKSVEQHFVQGLEGIVATVPAGRLVSPEDVAAACLWLASDSAAMATGTNIVLEGGGDWPAFLRPHGALKEPG